ncbi:MAG: signal recognition particle protein [Coprobacillus sp.]|nr:signal recognition particle protein [Coprobacillus sp.]
MPFENLTDRFKSIFKTLRGQARLTEANMDSIMKEIRVALLDADVNYKVVKEFTTNVRDKAVHEKVIGSLDPSQVFVKIVHDELEELLGSGDNSLKLNANKPTIIMMVGLQGTGKTTTTGKLAYYLKNKFNKKVLVAACDVYRPAAIDQLVTVAKQVGVDCLNMGTETNPVDIAKAAKEKAYNEHYGVVILDTAGRLQIDDRLMDELNHMKDAVEPDEILLLVDAMSGQDAVNVATAFNERLALTGCVMSKLDGDARGGAALSIKYMSGVPIKFMGTGEKFTDFDVFHPDRMADRILGMGDVVTLVEQAEEKFDEQEMKKSANRLYSGQYDLNDMVDNLKQVSKIGSFSKIMSLMPGMPKVTKEQLDRAERQAKDVETIVNSMTPEERAHPEILKYSRKVRIANGSGKTLADINRVLKQYEEMKAQMKQVSNMTKNGKMPTGMGGMGGIGGLGGFGR